VNNSAFDRRRILGAAIATGALTTASLLTTRQTFAASRNKSAFKSRTPLDALRALGISDPADSSDIVVEVAQIAENGAVVPVEITSNIPGTVAM